MPQLQNGPVTRRFGLVVPGGRCKALTQRVNLFPANDWAWKPAFAQDSHSCSRRPSTRLAKADCTDQERLLGRASDHRRNDDGVVPAPAADDGGATARRCASLAGQRPESAVAARRLSGGRHQQRTAKDQPSWSPRSGRGSPNSRRTTTSCWRVPAPIPFLPRVRSEIRSKACFLQSPTISILLDRAWQKMAGVSSLRLKPNLALKSAELSCRQGTGDP